MYVDAVIKLLPYDAEVSLFFVFDGDGRLSVRTFTQERALNKIKRGLARQVGPNTVQYLAVFNDDSVTFQPDITFPYDLIVLTDPLSGRHADETTSLIEAHNIEAIKNSPLYETFPDPEDNGIHNHYPSYRVDPMPQKPFGPMSKHKINKNTVRRLMRRRAKKSSANRNRPDPGIKRLATWILKGQLPDAHVCGSCKNSYDRIYILTNEKAGREIHTCSSCSKKYLGISAGEFLCQIRRLEEKRESLDALLRTAETFVCPYTGYLPGTGGQCGKKCPVRTTCEELQLYPVLDQRQAKLKARLGLPAELPGEVVSVLRKRIAQEFLTVARDMLTSGCVLMKDKSSLTCPPHCNVCSTPEGRERNLVKDFVEVKYNLLCLLESAYKNVRKKATNEKMAFLKKVKSMNDTVEMIHYRQIYKRVVKIITKKESNDAALSNKIDAALTYLVSVLEGSDSKIEQQHRRRVDQVLALSIAKSTTCSNTSCFLMFDSVSEKSCLGKRSECESRYKYFKKVFERLPARLSKTVAKVIAQRDAVSLEKITKEATPDVLYHESQPFNVS
ncbi:MAG: hypothetical protein A4E53_04648 [Pelotomaculum sp. PtaB.Bin104]|nr:MAG: hypothetical protein A4E53_04648 [Pelotomaculum sp. PtaB.Bin104]